MNDAGAKRPFVAFDVVGRPASYATANEAPWKGAVREAVENSGVVPPDPPARFKVRIEFRTVAAKNANEVWDIDNLVKPTLDAMEGVFGARLRKGPPQASDDRVDELEASKREVGADETAGARVEVWIIER